MNVDHFIFATAGHVDHGKSALVRALTGVDPDRLPEEKARGITIDLGFAHLDLTAPSAPDRTLRIGIVDVPGHEDFVKNMVAGVGSIDMALLVVAADDGWMPQTEEHLQILAYLGVRRAVVALTKIDLTQSEQEIREQIRAKLHGTSMADAPIVATSVVSGRGIEELKQVLAAQFVAAPRQPDIGKPRLAVDRAFTLRGVGTVVTGTLSAGTLRRGQAVAVQPGARSARIRTIQSYNREVEQALPGSRVALNLPDLNTADTSDPKSRIGRGDVVTAPDLGAQTDTLDVQLEISPRAELSRPLKEALRIRLHLGSGNTPAQLYLVGTQTLAPGQRALAQLRLESPLFAFAGDQFILRDWPEQSTLAGGVVLDPHPPRRGFRSPERITFLMSRAKPGDVKAFVASELARAGVVSRSSLLTESRFSAASIDRALAELVGSGIAADLGPQAADAAWWREVLKRAVEAIEQAHRDHPEEMGLRLVDLRQVVFGDSPQWQAFDHLVAELCRDGCIKSGVAIRRAAHRPALPPRLEPSGKRIRNVLSSKALEPPSRKELAPDALSQQALRFLLQSGEAIELGADIVLHADHYQRAMDSVRSLLQSRGSATVSEMKQALNTSRRIMV
ncbi:MAG TPA: selenocysteine-specific translation elongation factor, partial [Tepidisphaeraceae bacterium]|nr:selenocysteine-specific translation elongation factor [Tepidisphaeraceae bacterium]